MSDLPTPINRHEQYLNAIANGTTDNLPTPPITREEVFLDYIARNGGGTGGGDVTGVKGNAESDYRKGNVNITPENIGLGNVNNTSDASKPVSTATQAALDLKANVADVNIFHGTAAAWDALPLSEKVKYTDAMIEGGSSDNPVGNLSALTTTDKSSCVGAINEVSENLVHGIVDKILFNKIYGNSETPINIDKIDNENGYIYRVYNSTGFSGTYPDSLSGNAILLIGFSRINQTNKLPIYGVQIAISMGSTKIAIRNASYEEQGLAWGAWKYLTAS